MIEIRLYWIINWHLTSWFHFIQKIHHIHHVNLFPITSSCPEVVWSVATLPEWNLRCSPSGRGAFAVCGQNEFRTKACEKWWKSVTESEVKHASSIRTSMKPFYFYTSFTTSTSLRPELAQWTEIWVSSPWKSWRTGQRDVWNTNWLDLIKRTRPSRTCWPSYASFDVCQSKCSSYQVFKLTRLMHLIRHFICTSFILRCDYFSLGHLDTGLDKARMSE